MANPWTTFMSLMPAEKRWIGQIVSPIINGKAEVALPIGLGGGALQPNIIVDASSSYSENDFVFIEGGVIISQAPDLRAAFQEKVY